MPAHEKMNYVEYPARNLAATRAFFEAAFGWSFEEYGPDYLAFSGQGLDGGFFRSGQAASTGNGSALIVFYSERLEDTLAKVVAAGGEIVKPTFSFPGGRRFHFAEPSGNEFAVWAAPETGRALPGVAALLVIDVQQGLCEGEGRAHASAEVIERINEVASRVRAAGSPVFFIQHESGHGYLEHGSREWRLADGLLALPDDLRVRKTTPDAFLQTELDTLLRERGVDRLIVCGMHSEFCVDTTTRRALALGYPVTLVADAHTSAGNAVLSAPQVIAHHNATLTNISSFGPRVRAVASADIVP